MIDIVVPFFNQSLRVRACLRALDASVDEHTNIILVDDASAPEEAQAVRDAVATARRKVKILTHETNQGFCGSVMSGIAASDGKYVILLNSDTLPTPGFANLLVDVMERAPDIAAVGPVSNKTADLYQFRTGFPDVPSTPPGPFPQVLAFAKERRVGFSGKVTEAPYLTGMCLALERTAAEAVGWFGKDYLHGYFEDLDICCRLRAAGKRLAIREDCFVYHVGHASYASLDRLRIIPALMNNYRLFSTRWEHLPEHEDLIRRIQLAGQTATIGAYAKEASHV